ncbi:MAG TPA: hypothetical protein VHL77_04520 [Ferruginibacter sp.]|nr:hypothetical protein [Ferruginibacter sp.]
MFVRLLNWAGIAACIILIISCFLPWTFHADLNQTFNGFYSYDNHYGKPGKFLALFGALILVFMILPKLWAKRANLFISALTVAYAIKTYILFGSCYNNYCPQKLFGLYLMLASSVIILAAAVFPNMRVGEKR